MSHGICADPPMWPWLDLLLPGAAFTALTVFLASGGCGESDPILPAGTQAAAKTQDLIAGRIHEFAVDIATANMGVPRVLDLGALSDGAPADIMVRMSNDCGSALRVDRAAATCGCLILQSGTSIGDADHGEIRLSFTNPVGVSRDRSVQLLVPVEAGGVVVLEFHATRVGFRWLCLDVPLVVQEDGSARLCMLAFSSDRVKPDSMRMSALVGSGDWVELEAVGAVRRIGSLAEGVELCIWAQEFQIDRDIGGRTAHETLCIRMRANGWSDRFAPLGVCMSTSSQESATMLAPTAGSR